MSSELFYKKYYSILRIDGIVVHRLSNDSLSKLKSLSLRYLRDVLHVNQSGTVVILNGTIVYSCEVIKTGFMQYRYRVREDLSVRESEKLLMSNQLNLFCNG